MALRRRSRRIWRLVNYARSILLGTEPKCCEAEAKNLFQDKLLKSACLMTLGLDFAVHLFIWLARIPPARNLCHLVQG